MKTVLSLTNVNVSYNGTGGTPILQHINLKLPAGVITVIIGPNGSGKSTLIKAILELLPYRGQIEFFGQPVPANYHHIGYLPQRFSFDRTIPITVYELLILSLTECDCAAVTTDRRERITKALVEVGAGSLIDEPLSELSGGQLQRVLLAKAVVHEPRLVILDEPESGIDQKGEKTVYTLLQELTQTKKTSVVLVTHDLDLAAQYADYAVALDRQVIAAGNKAAVLNKKVMAQLYGYH